MQSPGELVSDWRERPQRPPETDGHILVQRAGAIQEHMSEMGQDPGNLMIIIRI
jgi:hypothetical protein